MSNVRLWLNIEAYRNQLLEQSAEDEVEFREKLEAKKDVHVNGIKFSRDWKTEELYYDFGDSVAFARVPRQLENVIARITLRDHFSAQPSRTRGLYEHGTARAELELSEHSMGEAYNEEVIRRYDMELVAEAGDNPEVTASTLLNDARALYFGIKEGTLQPVRYYDLKLRTPASDSTSAPEATDEGSLYEIAREQAEFGSPPSELR